MKRTFSDRKPLRISSPEWHEEMERKCRNPEIAWKEDWGFEIKCIVYFVLILVVGIGLAQAIYSNTLNEMVADKFGMIAIIVFFVLYFCAIMYSRRNILYKHYKKHGESGGYLWYREWRKTQLWHKKVDEINKKFFEELN